MFAFMNKWAANTGTACVINNGCLILRAGVSVERGCCPDETRRAGSEQLVSCSANEDNNREALTGVQPGGGQTAVEDAASVLGYWQTRWTGAARTRRSADPLHTQQTERISYLSFPSEPPEIQGVRWCPPSPGSRRTSSQWWGWVRTSTRPLGRRWCRPWSRRTETGSCKHTHTLQTWAAARLTPGQTFTASPFWHPAEMRPEQVRLCSNLVDKWKVPRWWCRDWWTMATVSIFQEGSPQISCLWERVDALVSGKNPMRKKLLFRVQET